LAANVANGVTNSYLQRTFEIRYTATANLSNFMEKQLEELRAKVERSGLALAQFERELNVINPEEKTTILSSRLLQLNTEYTNAETPPGNPYRPEPSKPRKFRARGKRSRPSRPVWMKPPRSLPR
jgi:hypothetical protein